MFKATEICCLIVLEAKSPRSRCRQLGIFLPWLADGLLRSAPLHGLRASLIGTIRQILFFLSSPFQSWDSAQTTCMLSKDYTSKPNAQTSFSFYSLRKDFTYPDWP